MQGIKIPRISRGPRFAEQVRMCLGMALAGMVPVSILSRFIVLLHAANQLVTHLDELPEMGEWSAKVILRAVVGATQPLNAGPQHSGDFTDGFRRLLTHVRVEDLRTP